MSTLSATSLPLTISSFNQLNGTQLGVNRQNGNQTSAGSAFPLSSPGVHGSSIPLAGREAKGPNGNSETSSSTASRVRSEQKQVSRKSTGSSEATGGKAATRTRKSKTTTTSSQAKSASTTRRTTAEIVNDAVNAAFDKSMDRFSEVATKMIDSVKSCTCPSIDSGVSGGTGNPQPLTSANQSVLTQISQELGRGLVSLVREFVDVVIRNVGAENLDTTPAALTPATPASTNSAPLVNPNGIISSGSTTGAGVNSVENRSPIYESSGSNSGSIPTGSEGAGLLGSVLHFAQQLWKSISDFIGSVLKTPVTITAK